MTDPPFVSSKQVCQAARGREAVMAYREVRTMDIDQVMRRRLAFGRFTEPVEVPATPKIARCSSGLIGAAHRLPFLDNLSSSPSSSARMPSAKRRSAGASMSSSARDTNVGYRSLGSDLNQRLTSSRMRLADPVSLGLPSVSSSTKPTTWEFMTKEASAVFSGENPALTSARRTCSLRRSRWGPTGGVAASTRAPSRCAMSTRRTWRAIVSACSR